MRESRDLRRRLQRIRERDSGDAASVARIGAGGASRRLVAAVRGLPRILGAPSPRAAGAEPARTLAFRVDSVVDPVPMSLATPVSHGVPDDPRLVFFDLETTGLSYATTIFLCGCLHREGQSWKLVQSVAGDVADERGILEELLEIIAGRPVLVTYNGRSYDLPLLRRRLAFHGLPAAADEVEVIDLLHPARRRYRKQLRDCRLTTLEQQILCWSRSEQDIPGAEAPLRYLDYQESGNRHLLDPVLYHNRIDLMSMVCLYPILAPAEAAGRGAAGKPVRREARSQGRRRRVD